MNRRTVAFRQHYLYKSAKRLTEIVQIRQLMLILFVNNVLPVGNTVGLSKA